MLVISIVFLTACEVEDEKIENERKNLKSEKEN